MHEPNLSEQKSPRKLLRNAASARHGMNDEIKLKMRRQSQIDVKKGH